MTGNFPGTGPVPAPSGPMFSPPPPPKPSRAGVWLGSVACVLAAAALVVGVVALVTARHDRTQSGAPPSKPADSQLFVVGDDREFCDAMGPLMRESSDSRNSLQRSGAPN